MPIVSMEAFCQHSRDEQIALLVTITDHLRTRQNMGMPMLFAMFEEHREAAGIEYSELGITEEEVTGFQQMVEVRLRQNKELVAGRLVDDEGNEITKAEWMERYSKDYPRLNRQRASA